LNFVSFVKKIISLFERLSLIRDSQRFLDEYQRGDRVIYSKLFNPDVIPNFTFTRLVSDMPFDSEIVDQYTIRSNEFDSSLVTILKMKNESKMMYHLSPPEHSLSEDHSILLNLARQVLIEHQPKAEEFTDTERIRQVFYNVAKDLLRDLSENRKINLTYKELNLLSILLVRHTIGFGLIEVLLQDDKLHDIMLNVYFQTYLLDIRF
jgi:hypothetical protein